MKARISIFVSMALAATAALIVSSEHLNQTTKQIDPELLRIERLVTNPSHTGEFAGAEVPIIKRKNKVVVTVDNAIKGLRQKKPKIISITHRRPAAAQNELTPLSVVIDMTNSIQKIKNKIRKAQNDNAIQSLSSAEKDKISRNFEMIQSFGNRYLPEEYLPLAKKTQRELLKWFLQEKSHAHSAILASAYSQVSFKLWSDGRDTPGIIMSIYAIKSSNSPVVARRAWENLYKHIHFTHSGSSGDNTPSAWQNYLTYLYEQNIISNS